MPKLNKPKVKSDKWKKIIRTKIVWYLKPFAAQIVKELKSKDQLSGLTVKELISKANTLHSEAYHAEPLLINGMCCTT